MLNIFKRKNKETKIEETVQQSLYIPQYQISVIRATKLKEYINFLKKIPECDVNFTLINGSELVFTMHLRIEGKLHDDKSGIEIMIDGNPKNIKLPSQSDNGINMKVLSDKECEDILDRN